jgi:hypothetical protein
MQRCYQACSVCLLVKCEKPSTFMSFNYNTKYDFLSSLERETRVYVCMYIFQYAHIIKIKLQHIVVIFHYCAVSQPMQDVIFATDHSIYCSILCVLGPLCYLGPCSSQLHHKCLLKYKM